MNTHKRIDLYGLASCGILAFLLVGGLVVVRWPLGGFFAHIWIVAVPTCLGPAGAVIGFAGLVIRRKRIPTVSAGPLLAGSVGNSVVFAGGLYAYLSLFHPS